MYLIFEDKTYMIRGAVFEVYKEIGCWFLEAVYQECLEKELMKQHIPFVAQKELQLSYKGEVLKQTYKPDLICFEQIVVEVKAVRVIVPEHKAQLLNYLKATNLKLGLLVTLAVIQKLKLSALHSKFLCHSVPSVVKEIISLYHYVENCFEFVLP